MSYSQWESTIKRSVCTLIFRMYYAGPTHFVQVLSCRDKTRQSRQEVHWPPSHLAVHVLEEAELGGLVGAIKGVVAVVPVGHHPPALKRSLLPGHGFLGEGPS